MFREAIPTWFFAIVIVRKGDRFLVVHERKHGQLWYLPAGRIEPGETLVAGAMRETLEETGVPIVMEGVLRVQHTPQPAGTARVRVIFVARPLDDTPPRHVANEHSLCAEWVTLEQLRQRPLRGEEVLELFAEVAAGAKVHALSVLSAE